MSSKTKSKGKSRGSRARPRSRPTKPRLTPASASRPELSAREKALKQLGLKPQDILSERIRGSEFIFVTKNGMKIRVKK